jgi:hypothetical protein
MRNLAKRVSGVLKNGLEFVRWKSMVRPREREVDGFNKL